MQCYRHLAAVIQVTRQIDTIPDQQHRLPYSVVAEWMAENDIEPDDVLNVSGDAVRQIVEELVVSSQPHLSHAA